MSYREFKLKNANGAEFNLTAPPAWLYEPSGLGWGIETEIYDIGNAYIRGNSSIVHPAPSGTIIFRDYQTYDKFLKFVQVGGTVLCYKPLDEWMFLDCDVSIEKSEINHDYDRLLCPVDFNGLSHWYTAETAYYVQRTSPYSVKRYTYKYSDDMPAGRHGYTYVTTSGLVRIENGGLESPIKISLFGIAVNPKWELYQNGSLIASGKINYTIPAGHKLVVNTRPNELEIALYTEQNERVLNLYPFSDFNTVRIFNIPSGTSDMYFTDDNGPLTEGVVEVYRNV